MAETMVLCLSGVGNHLTIPVACPRRRGLWTRATRDLTLLGLQRARGYDSTVLGNTEVPRPLGPLHSLTSLQFEILPKPALGCQGFQTPSPPTTPPLLGKVKILGWDRTVTKWPAGAEITFSPDTGEKELFVNAFKMLLGPTNSTLVWIIPYLPPRLQGNLGASRPAGPACRGNSISSCSCPGCFLTRWAAISEASTAWAGRPLGLCLLGLVFPTLFGVGGGGLPWVMRFHEGNVDPKSLITNLGEELPSLG